ncbi:MAG: hypothetical protein SFY66_01675 [Oculatellaceae cyanobacterium bins.114]|nr:hypothetical protein [Oculatellaceae cyanobacterium bins.114]
MSKGKTLNGDDLPDDLRKQQLQQKIYEYKQAETALQAVKEITKTTNSEKNDDGVSKTA